MAEQATGASDPEEFLSDFLIVLGRIDRRFAAKSSELMRRPEWSEVTWTLSVGEMNADRPDRCLAIWGYVDGELEGVGGVAWYVEALRRDAGWVVERELNLNANDASYQTTAAELPVSAFPDSRAFAEALPGLIEELLQLPAPDHV